MVSVSTIDNVVRIVASSSLLKWMQLCLSRSNALRASGHMFVNSLPLCKLLGNPLRVLVHFNTAKMHIRRTKLGLNMVRGMREWTNSKNGGLPRGTSSEMVID